MQKILIMVQFRRQWGIVYCGKNVGEMPVPNHHQYATRYGVVIDNIICIAIDMKALNGLYHQTSAEI